MMYENILQWTYIHIHAIANTKNIMYDNTMKRKSRPPPLLVPPDVRPRVNYANYFALRDRQRRWGPRTLVDLELILIVAGEFAYEAAGEACDLQDGDVLCIAPGIEHVFEGNPPYREELLGVIAHDLWLRLAGYLAGGMGWGPSPRTARMVAAIERGLPGTVSRHDLAREFGLSPEHVNALLRKETGLTPTQIRHRALIMQACRLLQEEGVSVKEAAARTGFHDAFHFSKVFKRVMGFPPGVFKAGSLHSALRAELISLISRATH